MTDTPIQEVEKSLLANLINDSKLYFKTDEYLELLQFVGKLRGFAPFNAFLLHLQKPGLRFAASQFDWHKRFSRTLKEGARPLIILWPFGPIALVYDLDDTEGDILPDVVLNTFRASGDAFCENVLSYVNLLRKNMIELVLVQYGDTFAGKIHFAKEDDRLAIGGASKKSEVKSCYKIIINSKHEANVQFVTLIHELAHLYLGHLGGDKDRKIPNRLRLCGSMRELEAESVAYIVCARSGVMSRSESYLAGYVERNMTIENIDIYIIFKAAGQIEALLGRGSSVHF